MNSINKKNIITLGTASSSLVNKLITGYCDYNVFCFQKYSKKNTMQFFDLLSKSKKENNRTILLVCLSGNTSLNFIKKLSYFINKKSETVFCIYTIPFVWEGKTRKKIAESAIKILNKKFPSHIEISYGTLNIRETKEPSNANNFFLFYDRLIYFLIERLMN